jgi:hypothetical protein
MSLRWSVREWSASLVSLTDGCYQAARLAVLAGEAAMQRLHIFEWENPSGISGIKSL